MSTTTPSSPITCAENPCQNGGTCEVTNWPKNYTCHCLDGYKGDECEAEPIQEDLVAVIVGIVCAVLLIIGLSIVAYFVVKKAKEKRRQHGTYSPSREEQTGRRIELNHVLKPPPIERLI